MGPPHGHVGVYPRGYMKTHGSSSSFGGLLSRPTPHRHQYFLCFLSRQTKVSLILTHCTAYHHHTFQFSLRNPFLIHSITCDHLYLYLHFFPSRNIIYTCLLSCGSSKYPVIFVFRSEVSNPSNFILAPASGSIFQ